MTIYGALEITTPSDSEIAIIRTFDAPKHLVFDAHTKPELVKRWLGVRAGWEFAVCEIDLRPGGEYRYVWRKGDIEMGMGGVYREIARPERIVNTELFDDSWYPGGAVNTTVLAEQNGKTTMTMTIRYESPEARDAVIASPMAEGLGEGYDGLANVLADMLASEPAR